MDKKLLVSLMMTAPVAAFGATSNWFTDAGSGSLSYSILPVANADNWTATGLSDNPTTESGDKLVCSVAAGSLTHNTMLPTGKYTFKCDHLENALIKVNGKYLAKTNDKGEYVGEDGKAIKDTELNKMVALTSFEVTYKAETALALEVVPVDNQKQFEIGKVSYTLDFNFATVKADLQADLDDASILELVNVADDRDEAKALRNTQTELIKEITALNKDVESIKLNDAEALYNAYVKYSLDKWAAENPGDKISEGIAALEVKTSAYNDQVTAENKIWDNLQTNKAALQVLNDEVTALQAQLDTKKAEIDNKVATDPAQGDLGEYCKFITAADIEAAQTEINDYKAAINAAYADLTKTVSFSSKKDVISGHIAAISYATAEADWGAYETFLNDRKTVEGKYGELFAKINNIEVKYTKLSDNTVVDNVYEDVIGDANVELTKIYNNNTGYKINEEGGLTPKNTNIAGAAANLPEAQTQMTDRKTEMEEVSDNLIALKDGQEAQIASAKAKIADLEAEYKKQCFILDSPAFAGLSADDQKIVKDDLALVEKALNAVKAGTDTKYLAHELDVDATDFTNLVKAFNDSVDKFKEDTKAFSDVIALAVSLSDAKAYVKQETGAAKISKYNLSAKFDETFDNIEAAIDSYYKNPSADAKAAIEKSIEDSKAMCDVLVASFENAVNKLTAAQEALTSFNKAIDAKVVVTINGKAAYDKSKYVYTYDTNKTLTATSVADAIAGYEKELSDIAAGGENSKYANPNEAYKAANAVSDKITADAYATHVGKAEEDFVNTVSKANLKAVQDVADDINAKKNDDPYKNAVGMDKVGVELTLPEGYTGCQNVSEATTHVNSALGEATALANCDSDLVVLAAAYDKVYDEIKKVADNYDAWQALLGNESVAQTALDNAIAGIESKTVEPAVTFYKGEFAKLQTELNNILKAINTSYKAITEVADKSGHVAAIDAFKQKVKDLENAMIDNQKYYDAQVAAAKALANDANSLIDWLNANDLVTSNRDEYIKQVKGVTDELASVNVELTKSFSKGVSVENNDTYNDKFEDLRNKLKAIYDAETDGYKSAVEKANENYLKSVGVESGSLDAQYKNAIDWVNEYRYNISNAGYYSALIKDETFQKNHNALQSCYKEINDLEANIATFVAGLTSGTDRDEWVVLNPDGVPNYDVTSNKVKLSDLEKDSKNVSDKISYTLAAVDDAAKKVADLYYGDAVDGQNTLAQAKYNGIKSRLTNAGLSADTTDADGNVVAGEISNAMSSLTLNLSSAQKADNTYVAAISAATADSEAYNKAVHAYVLGMSGICDNLDKVNGVHANNFVKDAINSQWTANFNAAVVAIQGYESTVMGYTLASAAKLANINDCLNKVYDLDDEWSGLDVAQREANFGLFDNSNTSHDNLEDLVASAKASCDAAKVEHEKAVANNDARKVLITNTDSYLNKTQAALDALLAWSGYHETQLNFILNSPTSLQAQLDVIETNVKNDASVSDNLDTYKNDFTTLQNVIENAYGNVFAQEIEFAEGLQLLVNSAFNNAKTAGADTEVLDKYDKEIKAIDAALNALVYNREKKTECHDAIFALEDRLCAAIDELEELGRTGSVNTDTYETTLAQLNNQYNALSALLTTLQSDIATKGAATGSYGEEVASKFGPQAEALNATLEGYKAEFGAAGADLISGGDKYVYMMAELEGEYEALLNAWQPEQQRADEKYTSDTCYEVLVKQLDTLEEQTEFAHNEAVKYYGSDVNLSVYEYILMMINGQEDEDGNSIYIGVRESLLADKNGYKITKSTDLDDYDSYLEDYEARYVRYNLTNATCDHIAKEERHAQDATYYIKHPGDNKGWEIRFHDAESILDLLAVETGKINSVDPSFVAYVPDPDDPNSYIRVRTPEENIEAYNEVAETLNTICATIDEILESAEEEKYIKGDIDEDGDINVIDVQKLINLVGEGVEAEGKELEILDVNEDESVNVADVTALINIMMANTNNGNNGGRMAVRRYMPAANGNNGIVVAEITGENGLRRYAVSLTNQVAFAAGQLDIILPDYAKVAGVSLGDRANSLEAFVFENSGSTRVVMTSLDNSLIEGSNGCVLYIDVEGDAEPEVENVVFSDVNGNAYKIGNGTTGVDGIYDSIKEGVKSIYNAAGQKLRGITKGVNIIRNADGSATKKIGK